MKVQFLDELIRFRPPFKILERIRMLYGDSIIDQSYFFSTNQSKPNQEFSPFPTTFLFYMLFSSTIISIISLTQSLLTPIFK